VLDIVVVFVHLLLGPVEESVLTEGLHLHIEGSGGLTLAILRLHAVLAGDGHSHLLLTLLLLEAALSLHLGGILNDGLALDAVEIGAGDHAHHRFVLLARRDLLANFFQLVGCDHRSVRS